jgi:hypothetical protein
MSFVSDEPLSFCHVTLGFKVVRHVLKWDVRRLAIRL